MVPGNIREYPSVLVLIVIVFAAPSTVVARDVSRSESVSKPPQPWESGVTPGSHPSSAERRTDNLPQSDTCAMVAILECEA